MYGFYDEIMHKYGNPNIWKFCIEVFDCLSISALVDGKIFCVHAGLSPEIKLVDQINTIDRKMEVPAIGSFCDLLWSDPEEIDTWGINARGAGWLFGSRAVKDVYNHTKSI
jgi:diadenosine tetraphosphatase ApaH/serine/threonine PP2A family protein phosphatase